MRVFTVDDSDIERARKKLAADLGVTLEDIRFVSQEPKKCSFHVLCCPPTIEVEISRDGMKAILKRIRLPIGEKAPKLTTDFVIEALAKQNVIAGIKQEIIAKEIYRILNTPGYNDDTLLNLLIAEGAPPVTGQAGRPAWTVDLKLFKGKDPVFIRKGEVVARATNAVKGMEGFRVTGEKIKPLVEEQFRLNVGTGIEIQHSEKETVYVAKTFGRLHFDEGIRMRIETKVVDLRQGLDAAIETMPKSFSGAKITAKDLIECAQENGVNFGVLSEAQIEAQLKSTKSFPAVIKVASGIEPQDGVAGEVVHLYKTPKSADPLDVIRAKEQIVFPGEDVLIFKSAKAPSDGKTAFGETLRGRVYNELPLFPGKGLTKEKRGDDFYLKATLYGRIAIDGDRIVIQNLIQISKDKMEATLDVFPQMPLTSADIMNLMKEVDILYGYDREVMDRNLTETHRKRERWQTFVVAKGKPISAGIDARIAYKFDPEEFKEKGLFQKKSGKAYFAAPGDVFLIKYHAVEAQDGVNIFREKIPVPKSQAPKDIKIQHGKLVQEVELGKPGDEKDPLRSEFRAVALGFLSWREGFVDLKPVFKFTPDEKEARILVAFKSSFGTPITEDMIKKIAAEESIRVDIDWSAIKKGLLECKQNGGDPVEVVFARAIEPKHGENAKIQYFVEYNGKPIEQFLGKRSSLDDKPLFLDCVRPGDVLAVKIPAGNGEDGKSIFGRRIAADRGRDESFLYGFGVDRSKDNSQIYCSLSFPGFVFVEQGRICVRAQVSIAKDKMKAFISLYPSKNPRFTIREDKVNAMLAGAGVQFGIKTAKIKDILSELQENPVPLSEVLIAEGRPPEKGKDASFRFAVDTGDNVGELRADGSIDFKSRNVFQSVKKGQLLIIKQPPVMGDDGIDVCGNILPGKLGNDADLAPGPGIEVSPNKLEFRASIDGIVEVLPKSVRVLPGLYIASDVNNKTGNVNSKSVQVFVRGGVLPDFEVTCGSDISIEKVAEACKVTAGGDIRIKGGVVGKERALISAGKTIETLYVIGGARLEAVGDITVRNEIMHSRVITGGFLTCDDAPGVIVGGEIHAFKGLKAKTLGAAGAETPTVVYLGQNVIELRKVEARIREIGLADDIEKLNQDLKSINDELRKVYEAIPEATKRSVEEGQRLQTEYRERYGARQELVNKLAALQARKDEMMAQVPIYKDFVVTVFDLIHPGTTLIFGQVKWVLKEPIRGIEIRWNAATNNFISKRI